MVVDDDAGVRAVLRDTLTIRDFHVLLAESGEEALVVAASEKPDLVILDLGMPGMTGYQVLDLLRQERPDLPVVVLSGLAQPSETPSLIARGARAVVGKPFSARDFLRVIEQALI